MFLAFYFFLSAWKSKKLKGNLIFAGLAGLSTAFMGLIWGGWIYIFVSVSMFTFISFVLGNVTRRRFFAYSLWIIISLGVFLMFSERFTLAGLIASTSTGLSMMVFSLLLVDFLVFKTKLRNIRAIEKLREKFPDKIICMFIFAIIAFIGSSMVLGFSFIPNFTREVILSLTQPYTDRLSFTVAENRQPYFGEWAGSFGPIVKGIPLFFWLFFVGSILLFHMAVKKIEKKGRWILTLSYIIFLFCLIFSRYSPGSIFNGVSGMSKMVYFGSFALIILASAFLYYKYYKQGTLKELRKINSSYLFLVVFFFVCLIGARSAIRLIMVLSPPAAAIVGYFSVSMVAKARRSRDDVWKVIFFVIAFVVVIATVFSFYIHYQSTLASARGMIPSIYTHQWQKAMAWVRNNTVENAVFAHWWDYGYWIQTIGNRATVLDGGNAIAYWNHLLGRHVLTGQSEMEALEFLYAHNATHLLIDSTEIGKYSAYSSIGSDENYDRYSQMPAFIEDAKSMRETKNGTLHLYTGNMFLDEDYLWKDNETGMQEFLPAYRAGIGAVLVEIDKEGIPKQPIALFAYQGKQFNVPMGCVFYNGKKYEFEGNYGGCLYIIPRVISQGQGVSISNTGASLFISEKSMRALWVKLYLFDEAENFELVHNEVNFFVDNLRNQGVELGDLIYFNGVQGPIKIWEIHYPPNVEFKPEYLDTNYKESVRVAKDVF
jgi:asparagine N-glycosylation enzyme membrane subunit Stt3